MNTALSRSGWVDDIKGHPHGDIRGETELVEQHIILESVGKVTSAKFDEVFKKTRALFVD